ncbi:MAG: redox-sensing transcriptional repressor Rex [Actinomycetes bacterium]|jgi:redox-sensing transcriptional repressor
MSSAINRNRQLSEPTIARLPVYQRIAQEMLRRGLTKTDSQRLGDLAGVTAATVRRDLSGLGPLGTRGSGYDVQTLEVQIDEALGHNRLYDVVIIGLGNLGRALVGSNNFLIRGAQIVGLYDVDSQLVGTEIAGIAVRDPRDGILPATIGVICTPSEVAQDVANALVGANIHAILNFSPKVLEVPVGTAVRYVDFSIELQILAYHLTNGTGPLGGGLLRTLGLTTPPVAARPS